MAAARLASLKTPTVSAKDLHAALNKLVVAHGEGAFCIHQYADIERSNAISGAALYCCRHLIEALLIVQPLCRFLMSTMRDTLESVVGEHPDLRFNQTAYPLKAQKAKASSALMWGAA